MTPCELIRQTAALFHSAGVPDPAWDSALLLAHLTGRPPLNLRLDTDTQLSEDTLRAFAALRDRRLDHTPLQYLTHEQSFMGHTFYVDERVLIPRPETELLAERVIDALRPIEAPTALDLCCGSGCIALSVALALPKAQVHAADLSSGALAVTQQNAKALGARITLHQGDLFAAVEELRFHLIVSNPPYIPTVECAALQQEVLREPAMALDGGGDGLDFYRRISTEAPRHLLPGGALFLEVGFGQAEAVCALLEARGFTRTAIHPDLQGIGRMVEAQV